MEARYNLAVEAIKTFHTGVSEDFLLKQDQFKELRDRLLKSAAEFYGRLGGLLGTETDPASRKVLAAAYLQLGDLTDTIGDKNEALAVHRKALALRRELAAAEGADVETRLDLTRSLAKVGWLLLRGTGDLAGGGSAIAPVDTAAAPAAFEEQRDLAERLEAEHPTDAVRFVLALSYNRIGVGSPTWGSRRRRRYGSARRWPSGRSWRTPTPPSSSSNATWPSASSTSVSGSRWRGSPRRR